MADVKPIPDGYPRLTPYLCVDGANAAIDFYSKVFGATERMRYPGRRQDRPRRAAARRLGDHAGRRVPRHGDPRPEDDRRDARDHQRLRGGRRRDLREGDRRRCDRAARAPRTSSTATAPGSSRTRSGTGGASPPTSRTSRLTRWSAAQRRWLLAAEPSGRRRPDYLSISSHLCTRQARTTPPEHEGVLTGELLGILEGGEDAHRALGLEGPRSYRRPAASRSRGTRRPVCGGPDSAPEPGSRGRRPTRRRAPTSPPRAG